jgi:hypothetical protein
LAAALNFARLLGPALVHAVSYELIQVASRFIENFKPIGVVLVELLRGVAQWWSQRRGVDARKVVGSLNPVIKSSYAKSLYQD